MTAVRLRPPPMRAPGAALSPPRSRRARPAPAPGPATPDDEAGYGDDAVVGAQHAFARAEELYLRAQRGDVDTALRGYREVVDAWYRGGEWANQWLSMRHLFGVFAELGDDDIAAVLHGALVAAGATAALPFELSGSERVRALVAVVQARHGSAAFDLASEGGRTLRDEEVIRLTLTHLDTLTRDEGPGRTAGPSRG